MKVFSALFLVGQLLAFLAHAAGDEEDSSKPLVRVRRGFGCPFDERACHAHCQSVGRRGGYCGNFRMTCYCYKN
uniref:Bispinosin n=1 Tax=Haemaphysalis bispinosa TaxID=1340770 RepID=A0A8E4H9K7_9ACAR|nr:bispinosin [Haemaphysalis bispinosa]